METLLLEAARPDDWPNLSALLEQAGLPLAGLADHLQTALVLRDGDQLAGCAALELYPPAALLRSVAVAPAYRGQGLGQWLTGEALRVAKDAGVRAVYLLTETAGDFFPRFGFVPVAREQVPASLHQSAEFQGACPASAEVFVAVI